MNMPKRQLLQIYAVSVTISSGLETGYGEVIKESHYKARNAKGGPSGENEAPSTVHIRRS